MKTLANQRDTADILRRLSDIRPESTRQWGKMSAHQMICHLSDSFLAVIGRRHVSPATGLLQRTVFKWMALYLPLPWPKDIQTRPEVDQTIGGTTPADFAADVAQVRTLIELITTQRETFEWDSHPIFGRMSESEWMRWAYLHVDHHLRQFGA
jgi:Protein of unknown function (DUF1569)